MKRWFDSPEFREKYHYSGPLGATCGERGTAFRLWAPTAQAVELRLYREGKDAPAFSVLPMAAKEQGLWEYGTPENLDGVYYDYAVRVDGKTYETADPYGVACGVNGLRSMVLDLSRTDPENWEKDRAPEKQAEQIIYELHIKDFSWDLSGGFDSQDRGKFTAFTKNGTSLYGEDHFATGVDYLKQLGVTHIQILPMYDYGSVDEAHPEGGYNWGYDPVNYNVPEGSYATDPYRGEVRIRQLKEMIAALHANGFRVIMDVVYNHTYSLDCPLFKTAPWYFYREEEESPAQISLALYAVYPAILLVAGIISVLL